MKSESANIFLTQDMRLGELKNNKAALSGSFIQISF
jgi:hypothetical protein